MGRAPWLSRRLRTQQPGTGQHRGFVPCSSQPAWSGACLCSALLPRQQTNGAHPAAGFHVRGDCGASVQRCGGVASVTGPGPCFRAAGLFAFFARCARRLPWAPAGAAAQAGGLLQAGEPRTHSIAPFLHAGVGAAHHTPRRIIRRKARTSASRSSSALPLLLPKERGTS